MKNILNQNIAKQIVHWSLLAVIVLYILTGFGITSYRIVESITFGLLTKPLAFRIHDGLIIPFIVLIGLHIYQQTKKSARV
jgi:cytochrome b subunit of formate dehydrogenase